VTSCPEGTPIEFAIAQAILRSMIFCRSDEDLPPEPRCDRLMDTRIPKRLMRSIATGAMALDRLLRRIGRWSRETLSPARCQSRSGRAPGGDVEAMGLPDRETNFDHFPRLAIPVPG